jgi:predicted lipoprotein with Yx(FWY)xxD motif
VRRTFQSILLLAATAAIAIAAVGCGGDSGSATAGGGETSEAREAPSPASNQTRRKPVSELSVATVPGLGEVLVDAAYKTLYSFDRDKRGSGKTNCYNACASDWWYSPANRKPTPGALLDKKLIGTIERSDGFLQETYNGWPLYVRVEESAEEPTHVGKKSYGGRWYPLHPDGMRADGGSAAGGGGEGGGQESETGPGAAVSSGTPKSIGPVLVDEEGRTLYSYGAEVRGSGVSACYGACASAWPPLITKGRPKPYSAERINASLLGTIERSGGALQVTYNGWPLYRFSGEGGADTQGAGKRAFGATWEPLFPSGKRAGG